MSLTFFWRCESTTFDGSDDFSAGDSTPTANSAVAISGAQSFPSGGNSVLASAADFYAFDVDNQAEDSNEDIYFEGGGSTSFALYVTDWQVGGVFAFADASVGNNHIHITMSGTGVADGGMSCNIRKAGDSQITVATGDIGLNANTWYSCVIRYSSTNEDFRIEVYDSSSSLIGSAENLTTGSGIWSGLVDTLRIGEFTGQGSYTVHVDHIMISDDYDEPLEDNLDIAAFGDFGGGAGATGKSNPLWGPFGGPLFGPIG